MKLALPFILSLGFSESFPSAASTNDHRELKRRGFRFGGVGGSGSEPTWKISCTHPEDFMRQKIGKGNFNYGGEAPKGMSCGTYNGATCRGVIDIEFPCTRCDLTYPNAKSCRDYPCSIYDCIQDDETIDTALRKRSDKTAPDALNSTQDLQVQAQNERSNNNASSALDNAGDHISNGVSVCEDFVLSEFFRIPTNTKTDCDLQFTHSMITRHFTTGVSNFRKVSFLKNTIPGRYEVGCEVLVDDVKCNSCKECTFSEALFEADCENIASGAVVTCENPYSFDILDQSLILQKGIETPAAVIEQDFTDSWVGWVSRSCLGTTLDTWVLMVASMLIILWI